MSKQLLGGPCLDSAVCGAGALSMRAARSGMSIRNRMLTGASLAAAVLFLGGQALAQNSAEEVTVEKDGLELDKVVVTAQGREESLQEVSVVRYFETDGCLT